MWAQSMGPDPQKRLRPIRRWLFKILFIYIAFIVVLYVQQRSLIYLPNQNPPAPEILSESGLTAQDVNVTTADGLLLHAWFFPPRTERQKVILLFHGNAGNFSHRIDKARPYIEDGHGLLLATYRGYGGNPGSPTEAGLYLDAAAQYNWLIANGFKPDRIVIYGESLGTGVAVEIAQKTPHAGLILETPYANLAEPAQRRYFFIPFIDLLLKDQFRSDEKIGKVLSPKLFLIAGQDETLGPETGLKLYELAPEPKTLKIFQESGHNTLSNDGASQVVLNFINSLSTQQN
jgi:fermentation-respiration switch protein FrsA (DUF1100 family)